MNEFQVKDWIFLSVLFLVGFWLWTLPIQENPMPFGEHDGAYIFSHGDHMSYIDKSSDIVGDHPISTAFWYSGYNTALGPMALEYPPPYLMDYSFAQVLGGERIVPAYILIALTCFTGAISMYLLMRKLYGFEAAAITSTAILFSFRTIMLYLWGQRHNVTSFVYIPLAIYSLYKYLSTLYENKENISYLYIFILSVLCTYFVHLSGTVFLVSFTFVFVVLMSAKYKKVPLVKKNIKHYIMLTALVVIIAGPFYQIYFGAENESASISPHFNGVLGLFNWLHIPENTFAMNPSFSDYGLSYIGGWTRFLLILGLFFLLKRRNKEDLVIISGLISVYIMFHLSSFGLISPDSYRIGRYLIVESYFFYALMSIAILSIPSLFNISSLWKKHFRIGLSALFLVLLISTQGVQAYKTLNEAYPSVLRITPVQYELAQWIEKNIPEGSALHIRGTLTYPKKAYIQVLSRRVMERSDGGIESRELRGVNIIKEGMVAQERFIDGNDWVIPIDYAIIDYSDLVSIGSREGVDNLRKIEESIPANSSLVYNKDNIKVYKLG